MIMFTKRLFDFIDALVEKEEMNDGCYGKKRGNDFSYFHL